jgi:hypothetical protein
VTLSQVPVSWQLARGASAEMPCSISYGHGPSHVSTRILRYVSAHAPAAVTPACMCCVLSSAFCVVKCLLCCQVPCVLSSALRVVKCLVCCQVPCVREGLKESFDLCRVLTSRML